MDEIFANPLRFQDLDPHLSESQAEHFDKGVLDELAFCQCFKRFSETDDGKEILQALRKMTIENETWRPSLGYKNAIAHGFAREGQNSIYRWFIDMANKAVVLRQQRDLHLKKKQKKEV